MTISCTAVIKDKRELKKFIFALNQLGITPEVHAQTVLADWKGEDRDMLSKMTQLFEPINQHSLYYSTSAH